MSENPRDEAESSWLLEPLGPREAHVRIAIGSDVELSPEALAALETLMSTLEESEVAGFAFATTTCGGYRICKKYGKCQPLESYPCARFVDCHVAEIF